MPKYIGIDPGHGGRDPGAVNKDILEKELNLIVAIEVKRLLEIHGFKVFITRTDDTLVPLIDRCKKFNEQKVDIGVSIHHNSGGGKGFEIIHPLVGGPGKILAERIGTEFEKIGQNKRRIYSKESKTQPGKDYYGIIRESNMPVIITEFAFIDNPEDIIMINSIEKLKKEAEAIARGICKFYNVEFLANYEIEGRNFVVENRISDGTRPKDYATRAEVWIMLKRFYDFLKKQ